MTNAFLLSLLLAASLALPASAQEAKPAPKAPPKNEEKREKQFPLKTAWVAVSVNGKPTGVGGQRPTFFLDDNLRANGFGGCNNYSATTYPLRANKLGVGPIALTRKACDKAVMDREKDFLLTYRMSQEWDLEGGVLVFKGARGTIRFERVL